MRHPVATVLAALAAAMPATADARPVVTFLDAAAAPVRGGPTGNGAPIAVYGTGFRATRGASRVLIGGREPAAYLAWGRAANPRVGMIVVQPGPGRRGAVTVEVGGVRSPAGPAFTPTGGRVLAVAPGGRDDGRCAYRRPCRTVQHAVDHALRPGDTLLVRGGPVQDDEIWVRPERGGRPGLPVTIRNHPGERPVLTRAGRPFIVSASHVAVSGLDFTGGKALVLGTETTRDVRVANSTFRGTLGFDAVGTHGDDVLVGGNVCDVAGSTVGTQGHCFYISHGHRIRVTGNVARGAPGYGIHVFDQQRAADDIRREITAVVIDGNTVTGSTERSGIIVAMGDEGGRGNRIAGVAIRGNTLAGNTHSGVTLGSNTSRVTITGNTIRGNGRQGVTIADDPTLRGVRVTGNTITQDGRGPCRANCSWYRVAHVQAGARARGVVVRGNRYGPGPPRLIGVRDPAPAG